MNDLVTLLLVPALLGWVGAVVAMLWHMRNVRQLADLPADAPEGGWPALSLISPACDEADTIEQGLGSALALPYPALQVVAVDDRSTDGTGAVLDRMAAGAPHLKVVHLTELPPRWLGKVHALARGVEQATGEWLLFADADVRFAPDALKRAVRHAVDGELDLLTALPQVDSAGWLGDMALLAMGPAFVLGNQIWRVRDPQSERAAGVGAFILVRRAALERSEGLEWLRLEVADDVGLGLLIKRAGGRLDLVCARGAIQLRWYASYGEMTRRMQKNWYAIVGRFSVTRTATAGIVLALIGLAPLWAVLAPTPRNVALAALTYLSQTGAGLLFARWTGWTRRGAPFMGVGLALQGVACLRAARTGARLNGVEWRGVVYPARTLAPGQRVRW